jgi:hypothetical protein
MVLLELITEKAAALGHLLVSSGVCHGLGALLIIGVLLHYALYKVLVKTFLLSPPI